MNIPPHYRELAKHSAIYGGGQVLTRLASFLLLPIYTTYLRPSDYGVIAILDLIAGLLSIMIASGMLGAMNRYHFEAKSDKSRRQVWWTGLTFIATTSTVFVLMGLVLRDELAGQIVGAAVPEGGFYLILILATFWFGSLGQLPALFLRIHKRSDIFVGFSLARLIINIALNVYFLVFLDLGITGILTGNLVAECANTLGLMSIFSRRLGAYAFEWSLGAQLYKFGAPLVLTGLFSTGMHQANRYFLNVFLDLEEVGLYSIAYTIAQAVNSLCLLPFAMIWSVLIYEIANQPNAKEIYVCVFEYFTYGVALILFGVSLFAKPLLQVIVAPDYLSAERFIPILCLAFLIFSLHEHFKVPVLLSKRTIVLIPVAAVAALVNIGANLAFIPLYGAAGAAWASVLTFAFYSLGGLWWYRKIDCYEYPLKKGALVVVGLCVSYLGFKVLEQSQIQNGLLFSLGTLIWLFWAIGLFGMPVWRFLREVDIERVRNRVFSKP
ncbi:MAG: undecaprenyl-diphospho-oligosaccharide flippase [Nitrospirales bacterium]|nr:MAG: undecaprenyl-diphospho-oligosaccharide flippase [Nitrospirales bacterium]